MSMASAGIRCVSASNGWGNDMRSITLFLLVVLLGVVGAPIARADEPNVADQHAADLAAEITRVTMLALPAGAESVWLAHPYQSRREAWSLLDRATVDAMRELGFAVVEQREHPASAVSVDYSVSTIDDRVLLVIRIGDRKAARIFAMGSTGLQPIGSLALEGDAE